MVADLFGIGDPVMVDAVDGFGGPARVVAVRDCPMARCKVLMDDGSQSPFWAHDFELSPKPQQPGPGYDSRPDTIAHIGAVRGRLAEVTVDIRRRAAEHDLSKLADPEKSAFDEYTPKLRACTYGSQEYEGFRRAMAPALAHHYAHNPQHPEYHPNGIRGMSLLDLIEMLADWKAATGRHADGDLSASISINQQRFGYSDELRAILTNTAKALGWL
jgi:hypothetical protein